jgi:L-cysteine:1D-myo-inositol 2-amino-2-deoxy-alpha-D-glucopyranoside ligase
MTIDLHGGGSDLIFPHHECEAAQTEAVTGEPFVRHWVHTGMVGYEGAKMSKSLGNLVFVRDLLKEWEPAAIRLAIVAHHYRSDWDWHEALLHEAADRLGRWRSARRGAGAVAAGRGDLVDEVRSLLDDDLATPAAVAAIDRAASGRPGRGDAAEVGPAAALLGVEL